MRRKDKEITHPEVIDEIMRRGKVIYMALASREGVPYALPICYGYDGDYIYLHGAPGFKTTIIAENPLVSFTVTLGAEVVPDADITEYTMKYMSVIGCGHAEILTDLSEKQHGLDELMRHYDGPTAELPEAMLKRTAVVRIKISSITGKFSVYPKPATREEVCPA